MGGGNVMHGKTDLRGPAGPRRSVSLINKNGSFGVAKTAKVSFSQKAETHPESRSTRGRYVFAASNLNT